MVIRRNLDRTLELTVPDSPSRPPLRWEVAGDRRFLVRQCGIPVLLAEVDEDRAGVTVRGLGGYRSPVPPLSADLSRRSPDWKHRFADALIATDRGPLHAGRWLLGVRHAPPPYSWTLELLETRPTAYIDWCDGCTPIIPVRPLSAPDAPRVQAYRRRAREGCLPPVLLWWVTSVDGWLVLDGHDRIVAALAEGLPPEVLVLHSGSSAASHDSVYNAVQQHHRKVLAGAAPSNTVVRQAFDRQLVNLATYLPFEPRRTTAWVSPGRTAEWEQLWDSPPTASSIR
ncbi:MULTISPECIES: hypothetical protein [unclassified Nocardia]|uniref:hypothetical protein n=1 Tax=unclassified Nocardia TaxID=2637762 RepID=UPI00339F7F59